MLVMRRRDVAFVFAGGEEKYPAKRGRVTCGFGVPSVRQLAKLTKQS
jgi:hypothetical protein